MLTFVTVWTFLLAPHAAPPPPPVHAVAVVAPALAPITPATTTTTTSPAPVQSPPSQPPATSSSGLAPGQCAVAWTADQTNPVTGVSGPITSIYRGDCGEAQNIVSGYPGAVVVQAPVEQSVDPGCSELGDCTSPTMGG